MHAYKSVAAPRHAHNPGVGIGNEAAAGAAEDANVEHEEHPPPPMHPFQVDAEEECHNAVSRDVGYADVGELVRPPPPRLRAVVHAVPLQAEIRLLGPDRLQAPQVGAVPQGEDDPQHHADEALKDDEDGQVLPGDHGLVLRQAPGVLPVVCALRPRVRVPGPAVLDAVGAGPALRVGGDLRVQALEVVRPHAAGHRRLQSLLTKLARGS
mmetsp:Transcript_18018/g.42238  ORF Transcript_18018/g.42238 Transcript_18018/m.42238 type:complete len:210 (+) Transcript_18018:718-1347(+)